ncbi:MAG: bifunctional riboflavin kinase/FAD synthetase [Dictyoglomus sp.]|nr:bifunctional riboflavin kinase/FAD synthetase [Dictyoglomus sp.]MCX7942217.1 bifunctional riboflavin kinase/FAD synthetase [Dictyoglomaceae bacterium]MDW8188680.1 bifunctional riboflavin kinase/FAD synthetase [Dictyoglomus sp.]
MLENYISKIKLNNLEEKKEFAITIGVFDGLHRGHQAILRELRKIAFENNLNSAVLSFEDSFSKNIKELSEFLLTNKEKEEFLSLLGLDYFFLIKFFPGLKKLTPEDFIKEILKLVSVKYICVGENFRFGYERRGDLEILRKLGSIYKFEVISFPLLREKEEVLSSSLIRKFLKEGNVEKAKKMLGYSFFIRGKIVEGEKLGRKIGFPTANIMPHEKKLFLSNGIYRGKIIIDDKFYTSAIYLGTKPTFNYHDRILEVHILDYNENIVGKEVEITFEEFIREERKFSSVEALKKQILRDIEYIKEKKEGKIYIITIDGPAGSGKTTIARLLAKSLNFDYLDSGALYRAVGWLAKQENLIYEEDILEIIKEKPFKWEWDGESFKISYKGREISKIIKTDEIGNEASKIGGMPKIRQILTMWQREYFEQIKKGLVLEGRDSGTVVFPNADLKLYITANLKTRAERRAKELEENFEKVLNSIKERDKRDTERIYSPLKIPQDAFIIDTSNSYPEDILKKIISLFVKIV